MFCYTLLLLLQLLHSVDRMVNGAGVLWVTLSQQQVNMYIACSLIKHAAECCGHRSSTQHNRGHL
jgi:hypothetical protein